jgi:hypothetical protein
MHYLSRCLLPGGKGDHKALVARHEDTGCQLLSCVWADRERRFFVATCSSSTPGQVIERRRWRQRDPTPNADPELELIRIARPQLVEIYYNGCGKIDEHNRHRQDSLNLEKKVQTMEWSNRANHTIFGMIVVDAFNLAVGCQGKLRHLGGFRFFLEELITDLIDNDYDKRVLRKRKEAAVAKEAALAGVGVAALDTSRHLTAPTPTKRRKSNNPSHRLQGACMVCKKPTTHVCRACQCFKSGDKDKQYWICNRTGKECMGKHLLDSHIDLIGS